MRDGWRRVEGYEASLLEQTLRRELNETHVLHGLSMRALARFDGSDDVLFAIEDGTGRVASVHLTWTQGLPEPPPWPMTTVHSSFESWLRGG